MLDIFELLRTFQVVDYSKKTNLEYFRFFSDEFERSVVAGNFMPEAFDSREEGLKALRIVVEDIKIKDLRVGLRWNRVQSKSGEIDLGFYLPFLDYCFRNNVKICLNIGPIKTIGWPEEHVPEYLISKKGLIKDSGFLEEKAKEYLELLLSDLDKKVGLSTENLIYSLQPENEAFNPFGQHKLKFNSDYLEKIISIISTYYPNKEILLNTSGRDFVGEVFRIYEKFDKVRFGLGLNFYYTDPTRSSNIFKYIEPFAFSSFGNPKISEIKKVARLKGYRLEVSEAQMDPWGSVKTPGNSVESLRYVLGKSVGLTDQPRKDVFKIRLWGLEYLTKQIIAEKATEEHQKMIDLIIKINSSKKLFEKIC